jgi:uncharacterized protein YjeT (DUF2065 family)
MKNAKRIVGIVLIIAGIAMLGFSYYIKQEVAAGNLQISSAQEKVDRSQGLFNLNPVTKEVGKGLTGAAQSKIDEGKRDVEYYTHLANTLQIAGIACIVVGAIVIFLGRKKG